MMSEAERRFREAERRLDELLRRDEAVIAARGVAVADESGRAYHYQNERLSWRHRFEVRRARGGEVEKVRVIISLGEEGPTALRVWRRAEIFQVGKPSRWVSTAEESLPLSVAARRGLGSIVVEAISAGEAEAAGAS
jgi:hypothetical protein